MFNVNTVPAVLRPKASHERITDMSSATGLTVPNGAEYAIITCEGADVRWTDDGTTPTANVGHLIDISINPGPHFYWQGQLSNLQFFETGTGAILQVSYYAKPGS